jgi:hypothetical protein
MRPALKTALALTLICLAWPASAEAVRKCRLDDRVLYQSAPCPPGFETLPVNPPATNPDRAAMAAARARARADLAAAEDLRRREAREESAQRAREAAAERQALACARQLEVIRMLESSAADASAERKKGPRRATSERKAYIRQCGPLPR